MSEKKHLTAARNRAINEATGKIEYVDETGYVKALLFFVKSPTAENITYGCGQGSFLPKRFGGGGYGVTKQKFEKAYDSLSLDLFDQHDPLWDEKMNKAAFDLAQLDMSDEPMQQ